MARTEMIQLRLGESAWLKNSQLVITALCIVAILASPAAWALKAAGLFALGLFQYLRYKHPGAVSRTASLRMVQDGTAVFEFEDRHEIHGTLGQNAWHSRLLCVVSFIENETGAVRRCVVCASLNRPDDYRRLLSVLRLSAASDSTEKMIW